MEMNQNDRHKFEALTNALEEARNGLLWYQDRYPEAVDGSDDEAMARINAALASAQAASAEPVVDARSLNWTQAAPKTMLSPDHWQEAFYEDAGAVLYFRAANEDVPHAQRIINLLATPAPAVVTDAQTPEFRERVLEIARQLRSGYPNRPTQREAAALIEDWYLATRASEPQAERNATLEQK